MSTNFRLQRKLENPHRFNRMRIFRYKPENEEDILSAIKEDHNWDIFTNDAAIANYRKSLKTSIKYVSYEKGDFCGYLRALLDDDLAIYICELYVVPGWRNRTIGRSLLSRVKMDFNRLTVYALSDEDAYYEKLGHKKSGSLFEINS